MPEGYLIICVVYAGVIPAALWSVFVFGGNLLQCLSTVFYDNVIAICNEAAILNFQSYLILVLSFNIGTDPNHGPLFFKVFQKSHTFKES